MDKMKFNGQQLFSLMVGFLLGSSAFVSPAKSAKQDSWIVILISLSIGLILFWIYMGIYKSDSSSSLIKCLQRAWGKHLGGMIGVIYIVYCIYIASRVLRDFGEVIITVALDNTSIFTVSILMMFLLVYTVTKGLTAFARTSWLCFLLASVIILVLMFSEVTAGFFSINRLKPVLENGWEPIIKTVFPTTITFPFGEVVVFLLLMHHFDDPKRSVKVGSIALINTGVLLSVVSIIQVCNLGVSIYEASNFPVVSSVSLINIGDFFTRLNSMVVITFIILGFIKISILFFGAVIGTTELFRLSRTWLITFLIGILILFFSFFTTGSFAEHITVGLDVVPKYLHVPIQIVIPLLLLITIKIKKKLVFS
jgi:spore germination protein KB